MAKAGGKRGRSKKERDDAKVAKMQGAAEGEGPKLPNMPADRDLKFHYDTVIAYKAKADEAQGHYRNALKRAEEAGLDTKSLTGAMKMVKKDPLVLKSYFQQLFGHFSNAGLPIQLMIFDTIKGTPEEQAYKHGFDAGEAGKAANNIYPDGTPPHAAYKRGFAHGIGKNLGQTPEQVDAALAEKGAGEKQEPWPDDGQITERTETAGTA